MILGKPIKAIPPRISLQSSDSTAALYHKLSAKSGYSVHRLRLSLKYDGSGGLSNATGDTLTGAGVVDGADIFVKDLGKQAFFRAGHLL